MSRDLSELIIPFRDKMEELLSTCEDSGYAMRPYFTMRSPFEQAKFWRQSRSSEEIAEKVRWLKQHDAGFIAHCIDSVGPQYGPHVTNAIPGLSWHQWCEAADCFWLLDNRAEWSTRKQVNGINGYRNYADLARQLNLTAVGTGARSRTGHMCSSVLSPTPGGSSVWRISTKRCASVSKNCIRLETSESRRHMEPGRKCGV